MENKEKIDVQRPILMTKDYWMNSYYSIARYYGSITINGNRYCIVEQHGYTIFEYTAALEQKKIKEVSDEDPCDLIMEQFIKPYKVLGRKRFIMILKENPVADIKTMLKIFKEEMKMKTSKKTKPSDKLNKTI